MKRCFLICCLFLLPTGSAIAEPENLQLGRLFLSPQQRQALDIQRMDIQQNGRLDGIVKRSDGYNSVWIDKRLRTENNGALPLAHTVGTPLLLNNRER
jgi:hypothetical protein